MTGIFISLVCLSLLTLSLGLIPLQVAVKHLVFMAVLYAVLLAGLITTAFFAGLEAF